MFEFFDESLSMPSEFDGTVRLFPLPNLVLFPHILQPLHIFEPRYREMTAEAISDNRLIAPVLLKPGWAGDNEDTPPVCAMACLGKIVKERELPDGRFFLLLRGLARVQIVSEHDGHKPFRTADVVLHDPSRGSENPARLQRQRQRLLDDLHLLFPDLTELHPRLHHLLQREVPLSMLTDVVCYSLDLDVSTKQQILEELDVKRRVNRLLEFLGVLLDKNRFSQNFPRGRYPIKPSEN